mmetsp:Transcript_5627/g.13244  ORF Transcript_5627/g.13244 Transcript_5627/m.13244 type:complete len:236 (+) Transcript_5627:1382-2089(+)
MRKRWLRLLCSKEQLRSKLSWLLKRWRWLQEMRSLLGARQPSRSLLPAVKQPSRSLLHAVRQSSRTLMLVVRQSCRTLLHAARAPSRTLTPVVRVPSRILLHAARAPSRNSLHAVRSPSKTLLPGVRQPSKTLLRGVQQLCSGWQTGSSSSRRHQKNAFGMRILRRHWRQSLRPHPPIGPLHKSVRRIQAFAASMIRCCSWQEGCAWGSGKRWCTSCCLWNWQWALTLTCLITRF